jgi:hypothetical protein
MAFVQDDVILGRNSTFYRRESQCLADDLLRGRFSGVDLTDFWSGERVLERDGERATFANMIHQGRPETRDAGSRFVPNAVIDDAGGSRGEKLSRQSLRCVVAVWIETVFKGWIDAKVVEVAAKVGEEVNVCKRFLLLPMDFPQLVPLVVGHFDRRRFPRESRVPRSAFRSVETASERTGVRKCRVDDRGIRKTEDEFPDSDSGEQASFAEQAIVCGSLQLE